MSWLIPSLFPAFVTYCIKQSGHMYSDKGVWSYKYHIVQAYTGKYHEFDAVCIATSAQHV